MKNTESLTRTTESKECTSFEPSSLPTMLNKFCVTTIAIAGMLCLPCAQAVQITSAFTNQTEDWLVVDLPGQPADGPYEPVLRTGIPTFDNSRGAPAGHVEWTDRSSDGYYFEAPSKFLGDRSSSYGLTLEWRLKAGLISGFSSDSPVDVILVGGGLVLIIDAFRSPASRYLDSTQCRFG